MNPSDLLTQLTARGIRLRTVAGEIQASRPGDILPDEREQLWRLKPELLELLAPVAGSNLTTFSTPANGNA